MPPRPEKAFRHYESEVQNDSDRKRGIVTRRYVRMPRMIVVVRHRSTKLWRPSLPARRDRSPGGDTSGLNEIAPRALNASDFRPASPAGARRFHSEDRLGSRLPPK